MDFWHFGSYTVNMYKWKSGEFKTHTTYIFPFDKYVFSNDIYDEQTMHYKRGG